MPVFVMPGRGAVIEIDGSYGEGGGQLVRTAVAFAALTGRPLRLANVRAKRAKPGLAAQHLAAVRAAGALCQASGEGLGLGATAFSFVPRSRPLAGERRIEVGTAGSVTLVMQALLPVLLAADGASRVVLTGGTDVRQAPPWDYFCGVLLPLLARMGVRARASIARRGYYPRGGGEVAIEVEPGISSQFRCNKSISGWDIGGEAHVASLPLSIAERMRAAALAALGRDAEIRARALARHEAIGTGGAIVLRAESEAGLLGAARVAERGVRAETLGEGAGAELAADLAAGAMLDCHAADQILVYLAMAGGRSSFTTRAVTSHAHTAMWLIARFLPVSFAVEAEGALFRITVG